MIDPADDLVSSFNEPDPTADEIAAAEAEAAAAAKAASEDQAATQAAKAAADKAAADAAAKAEADKKAAAEDAAKTVPLATHIEERNRLKAEIKELREAQAKYGGLEKEIADLKAKLATNEKQPDPPDFVANPKEYIDTNVKSLAEKVRELETKGKATEEQAAQHEQLRSLERSIKTHVDAFAAKTPDFDDALEYARTQRLAELKDIYPEATDEQLQATLAVEEFRTAATLIGQKRNPGEFIYNWAKRRGFTAAGSGGKPAEATVSGEEKAKIAAARDKAEGLGSAGGDLGDRSALEPEEDEFDLALKEAFRR